MKRFSVNLKPKKKFQPAGMPPVKWIIEQIDENALNRVRAEPLRQYLGASIIGGKCTREIWYMWRHALNKENSLPKDFKTGKPTGRICRLFERGHREEAIMFQHLREVGFEVNEFDDEGKQFRTSDIGGHFGGGRDARARWPGLEWFLVECKSYNTKRYQDLIKNGVAEEEPKYYSQMQIYMNAEGLPYSLFMALNKDDESYHMEWIERDPLDATRKLERAEDIISAQEPPQRLTDTATDWRCKFCDFRNICHFNAPADKSCRSCKHAEPIEDGKWRCNAGKEFGKVCDQWEDITKV
jgi:CRISPR/Cas system-associated exonuclease Cas4 (RecB family)